MNRKYQEIENIENYIKSEINGFQTSYLSKYTKLPIEINTTRTDSVLADMISEFDTFWGQCLKNISFRGDTLGYDMSSMPKAYYIDSLSEVDDFIGKLDDYFTEAFNNGARVNQIPEARVSSGMSHGIITNSVTDALAFDIFCAFSRALDDVAQEKKNYNTFIERNTYLINRLNATWVGLYQTKFKPFLITQNSIIREAIMEYVFKIWNCTKDDYEMNKGKGKDTEPVVSLGTIQEIESEIKKYESDISNAGWLPIGEKAKRKKIAEQSIPYLKKELETLNNPPKIEGVKIHLQNVQTSCFDSFNRVPFTEERKVSCKFNKSKGVYSVYADFCRNLYMGDLPRYFTANYGRNRNLRGIGTYSYSTKIVGNTEYYVEKDMEVTLFDLN